MNLTSKGVRLSENSEAPPASRLRKYSGGSPRAATRMAKWYAVRTRPRHEKRVRDHVESRNLECFLPLYEAVHHWKNGCKMKIELPLFPNYLFVEIDLTDRTRILEVPGVLSLVGAGPSLWPLPDGEVEALRAGLHLHSPEPHTRLVVGQKVRIKKGPLGGLIGVLLRQNDRLRVILSIEMLMQAVAVEVPEEDVEMLQ
jgi:transcription elongation factor/antiterminator RfaH